MKVSVVVPCLNEEHYLPMCIDSLMRFAVPHIDVEIIVVDAGSTDATVQLARDRGVRLVEVKKSTIAAQRNAGAAVAQGEILAFIDSDCTVTDEWIKWGVAAFETSEVVGSGCPPDVPESETTWVQRGWSFLKRKPRPRRAEVSWIPSANVWVRASAFRQVNGFNPAFETCEDADLGFRLGDIGAIVSDPRIKVLHHREPRNLLEFYKKEVWHGKNSFDGILKGRFSVAELPSLIAPVYFGTSILTLFLSTIGFATGYTNLWLLLFMVACLLALPLAYVLRAIIRKGGLSRFPQYLIIYLVYFGARTDALVRWLIRKCIS